MKQLNTYPDKLALQWLNEALCKTLNLKFSNQWLIFPVGLRLVAKICERHLGVCGEKMLSRFLKRSSILVPSLKNIDIFISIVYYIYESVSSFPNGSGFGLNGLAPHVFERPFVKPNGIAGLEFLKNLSNLVNKIANNKVPENIGLFFFEQE